jgi:hypothetical protein
MVPARLPCPAVTTGAVDPVVTMAEAHLANKKWLGLTKAEVALKVSGVDVHRESVVKDEHCHGIAHNAIPKHLVKNS